MTIAELIQKLDLKVFNLENGDATIRNFCASDLFSYVMDKAKYKCCWLTIMSNVNITAVAKVAEITAVLLCDGVSPDQSLIEKAKQQNITILGSKLPIFEASIEISKILPQM